MTSVSRTVGPCLGQCPIAVNRHRDCGDSYKGNHFIVAGLQFTGLVPGHHSKEHGRMQADMMLEK
jgi:hypothetical protein